MANLAKKQPLSAEQKASLEVEQQPLRDATAFYDNYKNLINGGLIAIVLILAGYFGYKYLYMAPREKKASEKIFYAQQAFATDSMQLVLTGDGQHPGALRIIKDYSGTKTANLAHYYAGIAYLRDGDNKNAIKYLKDFDGKGTLVATAAKGALAKAYMGTNDIKNAISTYNDAVGMNKDDNAQTPMYLFELGLAYEKNSQPEKAIDAYKRVRDEYPGSSQAQDIDRYLAHLGELPE